MGFFDGWLWRSRSRFDRILYSILLSMAHQLLIRKIQTIRPNPTTLKIIKTNNKQKTKLESLTTDKYCYLIFIYYLELNRMFFYIMPIIFSNITALISLKNYPAYSIFWDQFSFPICLVRLKNKIDESSD